MGAHVVIHIILHWIETRQPGTREAQVIGVAYALQDVFARAQIFERFQPCVEDRFHRQIVFQIPTINRPRARIEIEIHVEFFARRFVGIARQILFHVTARTVQALFFAVLGWRMYRALAAPLLLAATLALAAAVLGAGLAPVLDRERSYAPLTHWLRGRAGTADIGIPNGKPVDEWGIRTTPDGCTPVGASCHHSTIRVS